MRSNELHTKITSLTWELDDIEKDYKFIYSLAELFPENTPERDKIVRRLVKLKNEKMELLKKWWDDNKDKV